MHVLLRKMGPLMNTKWVLTNFDISHPPDCKNNNFENYSFISNNLIHERHGSFWYYDGYILLTHSEPALNANIVNVLEILFKKYGHSFIRHLKGNFILLKLAKNSFSIYGDRFGIKKYFYYICGRKFIFSNDFRTITRVAQSQPSLENMAIYALTYHFIDGKTIDTNIFFNKSSEMVVFEDEKLSFSKYWQPDELIFSSNSSTAEDIAGSLRNAVNEQLTCNPSARLSLSLTAGVDSRLLFSILLDRKKYLHTYTYGNIKSIDCVFAARIAEHFEILHHIYDIHFTRDSFSDSLKNIIHSGQALCSLHRAHRLEAIKIEAAFADDMFLGTMGGEFVKGANHDDYIISDFVYEFSQNQNMEILKKYLAAKYIRLDMID